MKVVSLFLILACTCLPPLASAQTQGYVWTTGNPAVIKKKFFKGSNYRMLDSKEEMAQFDEDGYVPPRERAALFHKLNLEDSLKDMDDMDKDMLVMGARFMKLEKLTKLYPQLSTVQLNGLRRELAGK